MRVVCDNAKCVGCLACVVTCLDHHYEKDAVDAIPLRRYGKRELPGGRTQYLTWSCRHCAVPRCAACPYDAAMPGPGGRPLRCDLCGGDTHCVTACPNGALRVE